MALPVSTRLLLLAAASAAPPNIVVLLTDDQDALLGSLDAMPKLRELVQEQGMTFPRGYANTPVCCPSRSSLLTGRYTHNHGALNNSLSGNCSSPAWQQTHEKDALAVHMQRAGYRSLYAGKYLNEYGSEAAGGVGHVPPGWTEWFGLVGNSRYYNYTVSDNGVGVRHGDVYEEDYFTDVLRRRAVRFVKEGAGDPRPMLLWVGTPAAHEDFTAAPQYVRSTKGEAPRTPSWNAAGRGDKHRLLRETPAMTAEQVAQSDEIWRRRGDTLRSVDDLVEAVVQALKDAGRLEETFLFFTGDNGFHLGQFGMGFDKRQLYEVDVRVPYLVRGPGVARNSSALAMVSHVDLAPTILDLATGAVPDGWDGRSYKEVLLGATEASPRREILIQYFGEGQETQLCGAGSAEYMGDRAWASQDLVPATCDQWDNTYSCLRSHDEGQGEDSAFCEFTCYDLESKAVVSCPADKPEGYGEYYDLKRDPHQLENGMLRLEESERARKQRRLAELRACAGQCGCQGRCGGEDVLAV